VREIQRERTDVSSCSMSQRLTAIKAMFWFIEKEKYTMMSMFSSENETGTGVRIHVPPENKPLCLSANNDWEEHLMK